MFLFGKKALLDAINNNNIKIVYLINNNTNIISLLDKKDIKYEIKPSFFSSYKEINHQGIAIATIDTNKISTIDDLIKLNDKNINVVILDEIHDPNNFGSIIRTCVAFGVKSIIYKDFGQVKITEFVIKSSAGAIDHINLIKVNNITNCLEILKKHGYWIYATTLSTNSKPYSKVNYSNKNAIIIGNENKGISPLVIRKSDYCINIPITNKIQSLNAAIACAIIIGYIYNSKLL